jgi:O-Antigen ligase
MAATRTEPGASSRESGAAGSAGVDPEQPAAVRQQAGLAAALLALGFAVLAWWGWKQGAYFGTVFYPGSAGIYALLFLLLCFAPLAMRLRGAAVVALTTLTGLALLTLVSGLWSPTPAVAVSDAIQTLAYAALFALGLWTTNLLGPRMLLALAPVAAAGALVGLATVWTLLTGTDFSWYLHGDATLRFPIGYRNANAGFFMFCTWPLLMLATETALRWPWRALAIGLATVLIELTILAQSRGTVPAAIVALLVYLALSPHRLRAAAVALLAAAPAVAAVPILLEVYQHDAADAAAIPLLRDAGWAIVVSGIVSVALAALALRLVYPRLDLGAAGVRRASRASALAAAAAVLVGGSLFVASHGGPAGFLDQRLTEFSQGGYPDLSAQGVRYGANVGSNRSDFWRVALDTGAGRPVLGEGAGSFEVVYLRERESGESPEDPHSIEMLVFAELGVPGLILLFAFLAAAAAAALRSRALGPAAAALVAAALATATQWFLQSSYDWLWHYPGVTAPAIFLLGAAAAPRLFARGAGLPRRLRAVAAAALVVAALAAAPLFLAERYRARGFAVARDDPEQALSDLRRSADLNPLDDDALLAEAVIEARLGRTQRALAALREAEGREPDNYAVHYLLARELAPLDPARASQELARARSLNPNGPEIEALAREMRQRASSIKD